MKKWKFIGKERRFLYGKWINPGDIIQNPDRPNDLFEEVKKVKGDK